MSHESHSALQNAPTHTNRLAHEKSPYLLQHAHNPVDWYPWGDEALARAKAENRPVFLSVGYSACHWCHVMERESFENEAVAALLNQHFVSIKVDREERPDVDDVYMAAVQMMSGHGGWPMSVFLLPDGRPFYGGTYFPPEDRQGRIGFSSLLTQLAEAFATRHDEVEQVAQSLTDDLQKLTRQRPVGVATSTVRPSALVEAALGDMAGRFDSTNGGFGDAPKFPPHHSLRLLLTVAGDNPQAAQMLMTTLTRMAQGGVYDHIGGGFHRYATDSVWLVPHFEKMLYDNALLARVYAEAYRRTGQEAFARVSRETCDWVLRDLLDTEAGGFVSALDADSEGEEGRHYVWSQDEIQTVLGDTAVANEFASRYQILPGGNYRDESTGRRTGANIPHLPADLPLPDHLPSELLEARTELLGRRYERVPPGKDDKVITAWNGLMIGALAYAGNALGEPRYTDAARRAAEFCLTTLYPDGLLLRRYAKGEVAQPGFLDDYAYLADGLLDLFDVTHETWYADAARALADTLLKKFADTEDGGFFSSGTHHETLIARPKDLFDGAMPSANGVAARVLVRLGNLPHGDRYGDAARALLHVYNGLMERAPYGVPTLIGAAMEAFGATETGDNALAFVTLQSTAGESLQLSPGQEIAVEFGLHIAPGYHLNAHRPADAYALPTVAAFATDLPARVGPVLYPAPTEWSDGNETLLMYQGAVPLTLPIALPDDALAGTYHLTLTVSYQACSETECFPPMEVSHTIVLSVI